MQTTTTPTTVTAQGYIPAAAPSDASALEFQRRLLKASTEVRRIVAQHRCGYIGEPSAYFSALGYTYGLPPILLQESGTLDNREALVASLVMRAAESRTPATAKGQALIAEALPPLVHDLLPLLDEAERHEDVLRNLNRQLQSPLVFND